MSSALQLIHDIYAKIGRIGIVSFFCISYIVKEGI